MTKQKTRYTAEQIGKLEGLEAIRRLPGMYIGNNSTYGLHHLLQEIFSNAADEVINGFGSRIRVVIEPDGTAVVWDDGRGIPVEWKAETKMSALTQVLTILHAGGKFNGQNAYASSGGLHGIGAKAANAMSKRLVATVRRGGLLFRQEFHDGGLYKRGVVILNPDGKEVGEISAKTTIVTADDGLITAIHEGKKSLRIKPDPSIGSGTEISFIPDRQYFDKDMEWNGEVPWDYDTIRLRYQQFAFLNPGLCIEFEDRRGKKPRCEVFHSERGLEDYIAWLNEGLTPAHKLITFAGEDKAAGIAVEVAMQYAEDGEDSQVYSFVNGIATPLGGSHVAGFQMGLTKAINKVSKEKEPIKGEDLLLGLAAVIKLTMTKTPQFSSQTKESLTTAEARGVVMSLAYNELTSIFEKQKSIANMIARQAAAAAKGREAAKKARQLIVRRSVLEAPDDSGLLSKLADTARDTPVEQRILFLVEGDSAGGSCKMARDRRFHAILANRGKIINAEKTKITRVLDNNEIKAFVAAMGAGIGSDFNLAERRYGRVAILSDADVDGSHIRALWFTFMWRYMRPLITEGHLYVGEAPLYRVYNNKQEIYCYSEKERATAVSKLGKEARVQRYKGLGEMNPEQLRATTLAPGKERLVQVTVEDVHQANHYVSLLMGGNASARRDWLMTTWEQEE